jgi:regulator of RNase E activity RraB
MAYDMWVDSDTLYVIDGKLRKIDINLENAVLEMSETIQRSEDFLSGSQFEKAKGTTMKCIDLTNKSRMNINYARNYLKELQNKLDEYATCIYS